MFIGWSELSSKCTGNADFDTIDMVVHGAMGFIAFNFVCICCQMAAGAAGDGGGYAALVNP
eukprot:COSAG06_NODE_7995_length_2307_cov_22.325634_1_plen_61_part_00